MSYESYIDKAKKQIRKKEEKFLYLVGELMEGTAKALSPVGTIAGGSLRQSINHKLFKDKDGRGVAVGTDIEYGIYVEKGTGIYADGNKGRQTPWTYYDPLTGKCYKTRGMKPQKFLEPAGVKNVSKITDLAKKVLSEIDNG